MTLRCIQLRYGGLLLVLLREEQLLLSSVKLILLQQEKLLVLPLFRGKAVLRGHGSRIGRRHSVLFLGWRHDGVMLAQLPQHTWMSLVGSQRCHTWCRCMHGRRSRHLQERVQWC